MPKPSRRSILVTGCSSGIGQAAANALLARGYRVFATARKTEDVAILAAAGLDALRLDLDDSDSIARTPGLVLESTDAQFETNVFGTLE